MVRKRRNNPKTDRSFEINHSNDEMAQGTLPSGDLGCIPKPSQHYEATPAPSPLPTTSHQPSPGRGSNPRSTNRTWRRSPDLIYNAPSDTWTEKPSLPTAQPLPSISEHSLPIPDDLSADQGDLPSGTFLNASSAPVPLAPELLSESEGWNMDNSSDMSSDDNPLLFDKARDKSHASSNWQTNIRQHRNPLLDSMADDINGIMFSLEEDEDMIHLRQALLHSMKSAPGSVEAFQHAIIHMLNTLLNENLFITTMSSMKALRDLQATLLTHQRVGSSMRGVASGGNSKHPLNTTHSPSNKSQSDPNPNPSSPMQQPPHVNGVAADDLGIGSSNLSHVTSEKIGDHTTQNTRTCSRRQRRRASAEAKKGTMPDCVPPHYC